MTIVVAGYDLRMERCESIFFAGDSGISDNGTLMVSGFKKVFRLPIIVKRPNIVGDLFRGYVGNAFEGGCAIAFAGSTLIAQQLMNSIGNHLSELYASRENGEYCLAMPCERDRHVGANYLFYKHGDELFPPGFVAEGRLIDGDFLANVVRHAITAVFNYSTQYANMERLFRRNRAEFILAVRCYQQERYRLFQYELRAGEGGTVDVIHREVPRGTLAVIGLKEDFGEDVQNAYASALKAGDDGAEAVAGCVAEKVQAANDLGIFNVCGPCFLSRYRGDRLDVVRRLPLRIPEAIRGHAR